MTTASHKCLAVCLGVGEDASANCTAWREFLLEQVLAFTSAKKNIKQPQGCFRMRLSNVHIKCQLNFVKPYITMNLPKNMVGKPSKEVGCHLRRGGLVSKKTRPERALPVTGQTCTGKYPEEKESPLKMVREKWSVSLGHKDREAKEPININNFAGLSRK